MDNTDNQLDRNCPAGIFRALYDRLLNYQGRRLRDDILQCWLELHGDAISAWLRVFQQRPGKPFPSATDEELWAFYAISRVNDVLITAFQPSGSALQPEERGLSQGDYVAFMTSIGFQVAAPTQFSPFYHEIVMVAESENAAEEPTLSCTFWPCLMLENMVLSRGGVGVRSGRQHLKAELATRTTLYWAFSRVYRPCSDRSHGWGHNSQWRTCFRRDYRVNGKICFNVDAERDVHAAPISGQPPETLSVQELAELVAHRCFVRSNLEHEDLFSYSYSLVCTE